MQPGTISLCTYRAISLPLIILRWPFHHSVYMQPGTISVCISGNQFAIHHFQVTISSLIIYEARSRFPMHIGQSVCHSSFSGDHFTTQYICSQGPFPYAYRAIILSLIIFRWPFHHSVYMQPGTISLCISGNQFAIHRFQVTILPFSFQPGIISRVSAHQAISLPLIIFRGTHHFQVTISLLGFSARDTFSGLDTYHFHFNFGGLERCSLTCKSLSF